MIYGKTLWQLNEFRVSGGQRWACSARNNVYVAQETHTINKYMAMRIFYAIVYYYVLYIEKKNKAFHFCVLLQQNYCKLNFNTPFGQFVSRNLIPFIYLRIITTRW